jgi:predicted N-acetyltransferase YhbS
LDAGEDTDEQSVFGLDGVAPACYRSQTLRRRHWPADWTSDDADLLRTSECVCDVLWSFKRNAAMHIASILYMNEEPAHAAAIECINREAFGPGRYTRAAERVREQGAHDPRLSFIALDDGVVVASVRLTPIDAGGVPGHLLGPLAVRSSHKNRGIGRELVRIAVAASQRTGIDCVILVGDPPYYQPLGFEPVPRGTLSFPGPVDSARILCASTGRQPVFSGMVAWRKS